MQMLEEALSNSWNVVVCSFLGPSGVYLHK